jgi:hypothetical protein
LLLAETDLSVAEVGARVGYLSGSHFHESIPNLQPAPRRENFARDSSRETMMAQCVANNAQDLSVEIVARPVSSCKTFSGEHHPVNAS